MELIIRYRIMKVLSFGTYMSIYELSEKVGCKNRKVILSAVKYLKLNDFICFDEANNIMLFDAISLRSYRKHMCQKIFSFIVGIAAIIAAITGIIGLQR